MKLAFFVFSHRTIFNLASFHTILSCIHMYLEFQEVTPSLSFSPSHWWLTEKLLQKAKLWVKLKFLESNCKSLTLYQSLLGFIFQIEFQAPSCPQGLSWYSDSGSDLNNAMPNFRLFMACLVLKLFRHLFLLTLEVLWGQGPHLTYFVPLWHILLYTQEIFEIKWSVFILFMYNERS